MGIEAFQIMAGKPAALVDLSGGGGPLAAMRIGLDATAQGEVAHVVFSASSKPTEEAYRRLGSTDGLTVLARAPGSLGNAEDLATIAKGKVMVLVEGLRAGVAGGDPWAGLATLEHVSTETGAAFLCVLSAPAPELLDGFGSVIEVGAAERSNGEARACPLRQVQRPRGALEGFEPTYFVAELDGQRLVTAFDKAGANAAQRAQIVEDADRMAESLLDHPGRILPQLEGVTHDRSARAVDRLARAGRVVTQPAEYLGVARYFPSEREVQARAAIDQAVLKTIEASPDIVASSLPKRAKLPPETIGPALQRLSGKIRVGENGGEVSYMTEAAAMLREQEGAALAFISNTRRFTVAMVAGRTGCPSAVVTRLLEAKEQRGDLAVIDPELGVYERSTAQEREVRSAILKSRKGLALHEIEEETGQAADVVVRVVDWLWNAGAIVREMKSGAWYFKGAAKAA